VRVNRNAFSERRGEEELDVVKKEKGKKRIKRVKRFRDFGRNDSLMLGVSLRRKGKHPKKRKVTVNQGKSGGLRTTGGSSSSSHGQIKNPQGAEKKKKKISRDGTPAFGKRMKKDGRKSKQLGGGPAASTTDRGKKKEIRAIKRASQFKISHKRGELRSPNQQGKRDQRGNIVQNTHPAHIRGGRQKTKLIKRKNTRWVLPDGA